MPLVLWGYYKLAHVNLKLSLYWLVGCSLFFYSWWNPRYLALLLFSILINFLIGHWVAKLKSKPWLVFGITINLSLLGYFKYFHFILSNFSHTLETHSILLPLAISFFTFQQIAYLVDLYQAKIQRSNFLNYILFISFFPQLIAGPIVHYQEMMPQFMSKLLTRRRLQHLSIGLTIFCLGLFKKVVFADNIAPFENQVFAASEAGMILTPVEAWLGALAYTFQLYFDFSGYSDMALGLARCFGIRLPLNFNSPYKATSITEFWRCWHMTLSRFLRDYLYIPLGGNRNGANRRYINLMITMVLGGLWHGAGWTYIAWGALHGLYLSINHIWQRTVSVGHHFIFKVMGFSLTFVSVVIGWVFFRAETFSGAANLIACMFNWQSDILPAFFGRRVPQLAEWGLSVGGDYANPGHVWPTAMAWMTAMAVVIWLFPNTQQFMRYYRPTFDRLSVVTIGAKWSWRPNLVNAVGLAAITMVALLSMNKISEFLYYQF